jgi:adenine deaminase
MHVKALENDYFFRIPGRGSWVQVIGVTPGQIITEKRILQAKLDDGFAVADPRRDIAKLVVIERHHKTGNIGIEKGAIGSSVAHDSHNLVVAGMSDSDMLVAARYICSLAEG